MTNEEREAIEKTMIGVYLACDVTIAEDISNKIRLPLDALDAETERANEAERAAIGSCEGASAEIAAIEADRDHWKARAEALERAIRKGTDKCETCVFYEISEYDEPCASCFDNKITGINWQFDEAKFAREEEQ